MTADQLANTPAKLTIEGVDASGEPTVRTFALCRSLPTGVALALDRDLIDLGKRELTPYHRAQPQLDALVTLAKNAATPEDRSRFVADRQSILDRITDGLLSGRSDDLAAEAYWNHGRASPEGICREIAERAKHAGQDVPLAELRAVVTVGNAGLVFANLQAALGEYVDPSTPAT